MNRSALLGSLTAILILAGVLQVNAQAALPGSTVSASSNSGQVTAKGESFKGFRFGTLVKDFYNIRKVRPLTTAHVAWDEDDCEFYSPNKDLEVGDFRIKREDIYLIFWQGRLFRIRIINTFRGSDEADLKFFSAMRAALTQKYGSAPSKEQVFTRYDGLYEWKTETLRIKLTYATLEYNWLELEQKLAKSLRKNTRITSNDI